MKKRVIVITLAKKSRDNKSTEELLLRFIVLIKITKTEAERNKDKILDRGVLNFQLAELNIINLHNNQFGKENSIQ